MSIEEELNWVAGFFDGEGSISLVQSGKSFTGIVCLTQKDPNLLQEAKRIVSNVGVEGKLWYSKRSTQSCQLSFNGYKGTAFLLKILPFVRNIKQRLRAEIYMEMWPPGVEKGKYRKRGRRLEKATVYVKWLKLRIREEGG